MTYSIEEGAQSMGLWSGVAGYRRLPPEERRALVRVWLLVVVTRLVLPRRGVARTRAVAERLAPRTAIPPARLAVLAAAAARAWPGAIPCLPRAVALEALLRAGGHAAELRIGVAPRHGRERLDAHAWVQVDGVPLDGDPSPYVAVPVFGTRP
jgi:transglutaminase superfamily protein